MSFNLKHLLTVFVVLCLATLGTHANAQFRTLRLPVVCSVYDAVARLLNGRGFYISQKADAEGGWKLELWQRNRAFVLVGKTGGVACIVASGPNWKISKGV